MKKLLVLLMTVACALCLVFAVAGCKPDGGESSGGTNTQQGETGGTEETGSGSEETGGGHVHNYGNLIPEKSATCTEEGLQAHYYCSGCQKYFDSEKSEKTLAELKNSVDPNAHKWGEWIETEPTCEKQGGELRVCKLNNSHTELKNPIPALGHILEENQVLCKTCNEQLAESLKFILNSDNTYKITSGTPTSDGKIIIPKIYNNLPVTSIGSEAFYGCTKLESVTIGNSVTSIGSDAFEGCRSLKGVYITDIAAWCKIDFGSDDANPLYYAHNLYLNNQLVTELTAEMLQGVTIIKRWAFDGCKCLTCITIPYSVTSIGDWAFNNCKSLTSVYITDIAAWCNIDFGLYSSNPLFYAHNLYLDSQLVTELTAEMLQGVTKIKDDAFAGFGGTSITIPGSVTSIGREAFYGCTSLTSITIPDSVTYIGDCAFIGVQVLKAITVSDKNTKYASQDGILYNKDKTELIQVPQTKTSITIPNSVTSIGRYAFYNCTNITSVTIGNGVTSIGGWAFYKCTNLTSVTIPNSVTSIGDSAFSGCTNLTSITLPDSVTSIGGSAFSGCTSLTSVTFTNPNGWYRTLTYSATSGTDIKSEALHDPKTAATYLKDTYRNYIWYRKTT